MREQTAILWEETGPDGLPVSRWNRYRSRGLAHAKERIGDLAQAAGQLLAETEPARILEIGCGFGCALVELNQLFGGRVETHGINLEPAWNGALVERFAVEELGVAPAEAARLMPAIHLADAGRRLPFENDWFHLVFSQHMFQYIPDKLRLLEEVHRVLAPGGMARIDLNDSEPSLPREFQNRIEIWTGGQRLDLMEYLGCHSAIRVERSRLRPDGYVVMGKRDRLNFRARLVGCIALDQVRREWGGVKSVYAV